MKAYYSSPCWTDSLALDGNGYSQKNIGGGKVVKGHRLAWEVLVGPCPPNLEPDHLCRNRACYNPAHIEFVSHEENMQRALIGKATRSRVCLKCGVFLSTTTAYRCKNTECVGGWLWKCKSCYTERQRKYRGGFGKRNSPVCLKCGEFLNEQTAYRYTRSDVLKGWIWKCKKCALKQQQAYREGKKAGRLLLLA